MAVTTSRATEVVSSAADDAEVRDEVGIDDTDRVNQLIRQGVIDRRRSRIKDRAIRVIAPAVTTLVFLGLWHRWAESANSLMIEKPVPTIRAIGDLVTSGEFWSAAQTTSVALLVGFSIAVVLGVAIGILMSRYRVFERVADIYISLLLVLPMAGLIPVLIMATGFTLQTRVIVVVLFSIPMVIVNTRAGVRSVNVSLYDMTRCFGGNERDIWRHIVIPGAAPGIATGLRLGLARAITGTLVVELLLVPVGLGGLILDYRAYFQADLLYATVILIVFFSFGLLALLRLAERYLLPWAHISR